MKKQKETKIQAAEPTTLDCKIKELIKFYKQDLVSAKKDKKLAIKEADYNWANELLMQIAIYDLIIEDLEEALLN